MYNKEIFKKNLSYADIAIILGCINSNYSYLEEIAAPEPEPVPVVERSVRSRGKAPVTVRTSSRRQTKVSHRLPFPNVGDGTILPVYFNSFFLSFFLLSFLHEQVVEEIITQETPKKANESVVEDILANEISTPTGIR